MSDQLPHKVFVIINPVSGVRHRGLAQFKRLIAETIDSRRYLPDFYVTNYAGHAADITRKGLESGVSYFMVAGGMAPSTKWQVF